jgi:hypothetical protein
LSAIQSRLITFYIAGDIFSDPKVEENQHANAKGNGENRHEYDRIREIPHRHNSLCLFDVHTKTAIARDGIGAFAPSKLGTNRPLNRKMDSHVDCIP